MRQITVIVDNRVGVVADVMRHLADEGINVESMSVESTSVSAAGETGAIVMNVERYDRALRVLRDAGFEAVSEDALVVRIDDRPGALAKIAERFHIAGINIRSVRFIRRGREGSLVAIVTERTDEAIALVQDILVG